MSFLSERRNWLRVETVDREGDRWDVVLRIDGTYVGDALATRAEMVAFYTRWISSELGQDFRAEFDPASRRR